MGLAGNPIGVLCVIGVGAGPQYTLEKVVCETRALSSMRTADTASLISGIGWIPWP